MSEELGRTEQRLQFQEILAVVSRRVGAPRTSNRTDRRRMPRQESALRARCSVARGESRCLVTDVSGVGLSLACGHAHNIGERVLVLLEKAAVGLDAEIECVVRRVAQATVGVEIAPGADAETIRHLSDFA